MRRVGLALVALAVAGCAKATPPGRAEPDAGARADVVRVDPSILDQGRVRIGKAERRAPRGDLRLPGEVEPAEGGVAEVGPLVAGRLASIDVREGDAVKRGQVLGWVDSPEAARAVAEAIRAGARAGLAKKKLARQEALASEQATSANAVDEARAEVLGADADHRAARAVLASLGVAEPAPGAEGIAGRVPLRSPIDGVVTERLALLGAPVSADKTVLRVTSRAGIFVHARLPETAGSAPAVGAEASALPRGASNRAPCRLGVVAIVGVVDAPTRTTRVRLAPREGCAWLTPGAYVDVRFDTPPAPGVEAPVVVPREAVTDLRGAPCIFVAEPERGAFRARLVHQGLATAEDVVIDDGLAPGEVVATSGALLLKGQLLRAELGGD